MTNHKITELGAEKTVNEPKARLHSIPTERKIVSQKQILALSLLVKD